MIINSRWNKQNFLLFVLLMVVSLNNTVAQNSIASPYSRYGIGEITSKGFGQNFAMGGTSTALQNDSLLAKYTLKDVKHYFINNGNPASYSTVHLTTADLGINYNRVQLESKNSKSTLNNASLGHVALAFPLTKWSGAAIGVVPYSSVGYRVSDQNEITNVGTVDYLYEGSGGLNQLFLGIGFKPFLMHSKLFYKSNKYARLKAEKNYAEMYSIVKRRKILQDLSLGANVSYLFGGIDNTRRTIFPSGSISFFNTKTSTNTRVNDINVDYGMQYSYIFDSINGRDLKENVKLLFGATYSAQTNLNAKIDTISYSFFYNSIGTEIPKDTMQFSENTKGSITFPMSFSVGLGIKKGDKILVAADFGMQNWSSYRVFNQTQGLKNSMRVSMGMQYTPNYNHEKYIRRINYRAGVRYTQTALELKSTQLTEYAVSLGLGLPIAKKYLFTDFGMINVGVEVGQRGTLNNGLVRENFFRASIGFTLNDKWFIPRKVD